MPFHTSTPFQDGFLEQGCGVTPGITNGVAEACGRGTLSSFNNTETLQAHMQSTYKYVKAVSSSWGWLGVYNLWPIYSTRRCMACCTASWSLAASCDTLLTHRSTWRLEMPRIYTGGAIRSRAWVCLHAAAHTYPKGMEARSKNHTETMGQWDGIAGIWDQLLHQALMTTCKAAEEMLWCRRQKN